MTRIPWQFRCFQYAWVLSAVLSLILSGCGSKQQEAEQTSAPPAARPAEPETSAYAVAEVPGGVVRGRVVLDGRAPAPEKITVNQDSSVCGSHKENYPVRVEGGGIVEAVVFIEGIKQGKEFSFPEPVLDQKGCTFLPHVVLMAPGELKVVSSDPVPHNIHTYPEINRPANEVMSSLRRTLNLRFARPERIPVKCDLHGWMSAFIVVAANPYYATTGAGGRFQLDDVPAGPHRVKVWHETLGELEQEVAVEPGKTVEAVFTYKSN